ncbi:MAG: PHP domain-containing protein, partial [Allobaculum sp.]|nr:PHP domain-containing protein [Allobaculum sp.]
WIFGLILVYTPRYELKVRHSNSPISASLQNQPVLNQIEEEPQPTPSIQEEADFTSVPAPVEEKPTPPLQKEKPATLDKHLTRQEFIQNQYQQNEPQESSEHTDLLPLSKVDLHIRSDYSDDSNADIEDIIIKAKNLGLTCISITDHNNARSSEQAIPFASHHGLKFIPGVEVDCEIFGERVRILGYYINWKLDEFVLMENASLERERNVSEQRIALFEKAMGIKFNTEALMANSRFKIVRPHELTNLVFDTQATRQLPVLVEYLQKFPTEEQARKQFSRDFFGPGGSCEVVASYPSAESIIELIRDKAGGIPILAGWHLDQISDDAIEGLIDAGIQGFEVFTPNNSRQTKAFL